MHKGCDRFYDTTEVTKGTLYSYKENGQSFLIRFLGLNEDPGQFTLADSETNPLGGTNITYGGYTIVPYGGHASTYNESDNTTHTNETGTNLFYEPIPFEFIRTFEELP
jgi:hypothetical protein